jgi:hypothetical protein
LRKIEMRPSRLGPEDSQGAFLSALRELRNTSSQAGITR